MPPMIRLSNRILARCAASTRPCLVRPFWKRNPAWLGAIALLLLVAGVSAAAPSTLRVLFLGDNGHHKPADRFKQLQPVFAKEGIELVYSDDMADLNPGKLAGFDCLAIYANTTRISPAQEKAMLDFVAAGGGFVPIHCAS